MLSFNYTPDEKIRPRTTRDALVDRLLVIDNMIRGGRIIDAHELLKGCIDDLRGEAPLFY